MKTVKRKLIIPVFSGLVAFGATVVYAATALCYYSFGPVSGGQSTFYSTSTFSSTTGSILVKGWQITKAAPNSQADVYYSVVKRGYIWDTTIGDEAHVIGNYPQNGTWFSAYCTNIPSGSGYSLRIDPVSSDYTSGAGNAYQ